MDGNHNYNAFFLDLPILTEFNQVSDINNYHQVPDDWSLVITDVQGSTKAIEAGRYKDVNTLGVGSIVAVRNALKGHEIPFVFGGDGATLLIPTALMSEVKPALRGLRTRAKDVFQLGLRVGVVPIKELNELGEPVLLARYRLSEHINLAMFAGNGISVGEKMVKDPENGHRYKVDEDGPSMISLEGLECRWCPIQNTNGQVVSLMVQEQKNSQGTYARILEKLNEILEQKDGRPVGEANMQLQSDITAFNTESSLKTGLNSGFRFMMERFKISVITLVGRILLSIKKDFGGFPGSHYLDQVIMNSDFRKFDDTLRMVLDLSLEQIAEIEAYLENEYQQGKIVYGMHNSDSALMTCVIESHEGDHVHFVDGSNGGYAMAAKGMKAQFKKIKEDKDS
jgi:hypothetical protein